MVNSYGMITAYLGDEFSYSYLAATCKGLSGLTGYHTITATLEAVKNGEADCAIVPIENSVEGSVTETLDALKKLNLYIVSELNMPISHSLIILKGADINNVDTVFGHPQALSQCRASLSKLLLNATPAPCLSTSDALKKVVSLNQAAVAGTCLPNMVEAFKAIEDYKNNVTRFVVVKKDFLREGNKVSVVFETKDEPGALFNVLGLISKKGLNMTKIESRPSKAALGKYVFFVDFVFRGTFVELNNVFGDLQNGGVTELKFLGFY